MPLCRSLGAAAWPRGLVLARCDLVLCSQRGTVTRSPSTAAVTHRWHNLPPALGRGKALCLPFKASGAYCTKQGEEKRPSPSKKCKGEAGAGAFIAGALNRREEQGLSSLPLALSRSTKQPPSLASEIQ